MSGHTKGPWGIAPINDSQPDAAVICTRAPSGDIDRLVVAGCSPEWLADARRIVAAVNACEGIPTETLEKGRVYAPDEE